MDMTEYYRQLLGFKIISFRMEEDDYGMDPFPIFTIFRQETGEMIEVTISSDPEGNGGGFAFIEPVAHNAGTTTGTEA